MEYGFLGPSMKLTPVGGDSRVVVYNGGVGHLQLLVQGHGSENNLQFARGELARVSTEG